MKTQIDISEIDSALAVPSSGVELRIAAWMSVVKTSIRAGLPIRRGTSKLSIPRTNSSSSVDSNAGRIIGIVTRRAICSALAPDIDAASSMRTSSERKAGPSSR